MFSRLASSGVISFWYSRLVVALASVSVFREAAQTFAACATGAGSPSIVAIHNQSLGDYYYYYYYYYYYSVRIQEGKDGDAMWSLTNVGGVA